MSTFVLLHGGGHGAWCWRKVTPLLEEQGHHVLAPDLPGHGDDLAPIGTQTLATYTQRIVDVLDTQSEPVVLVGHSMGGLTISRVAEERPEKVAVLVYLSAFLLKAGQSCATLMTLAESDFTVDVTQGTVLLTQDKERLHALFYHDCSPEDVSDALARLGPEPLAVLTAPLRLTEERFGRVPRVYITTLDDPVIPPDAQRGMYTASPCQEVFELSAGHSSFYSLPLDLVALLEKIAGLSPTLPVQSHPSLV